MYIDIVHGPRSHASSRATIMQGSRFLQMVTRTSSLGYTRPKVIFPLAYIEPLLNQPVNRITAESVSRFLLQISLRYICGLFCFSRTNFFSCYCGLTFIDSDLNVICFVGKWSSLKSKNSTIYHENCVQILLVCVQILSSVIYTSQYLIRISWEANDSSIQRDYISSGKFAPS